MNYTDQTIFSGHIPTLATSIVHNDTILNDEPKTLPVTKSSIIIPSIMFCLGILGNGLAIASLLLYRWRTVHCDVPTNTSLVHQHTIKAHSYANDGVEDENQNHEVRRFSSPNIARNKIDMKHMRSTMKSRQRRRMRKFGPFHTLVLGLLFVDLIGNLMTSPVTLLLYSRNVRIKAMGGEHLCNYSAFAMMFLGIVTMATLFAMAVERVLSIRHAYFYHKHVTSRKASVVILLIVIASAIFTALPSAGFGEIRQMYPFTWCFSNWHAQRVKDQVYNYMYAAIGGLMIVATVACNFSVVAGLLGMKSRIKTNRRRHLRRETQMIIQLIVMTSVYLVCWLPLIIRIMVNQTTMGSQPEHDRVAIWLAAANPILDPWVYILFRGSVIKRLSLVAKSILCIPKLHYVTPKVVIVPSTGSRSPKDFDVSCDNKNNCNIYSAASVANLSLPLNSHNSRFEFSEKDDSKLMPDSNCS